MTSDPQFLGFPRRALWRVLVALVLQCDSVNECNKKWRKKQQGKKIIKTVLGGHRSRIQLQFMS